MDTDLIPKMKYLYRMLYLLFRLGCCLDKLPGSIRSVESRQVLWSYVVILPGRWYVYLAPALYNLPPPSRRCRIRAIARLQGNIGPKGTGNEAFHEILRGENAISWRTDGSKQHGERNYQSKSRGPQTQGSALLGLPDVGAPPQTTAAPRDMAWS